MSEQEHDSTTDVELFFEALHGGVPGVIEIRPIPPDKKPRPRWAKTPKEAARIALEGGQRVLNIHPGIATRLDSSSGEKENLRAVKAIWVDSDGDPEALAERLADFPHEPSIRIASGGPGSLHIYWLLEEHYDLRTKENRERFENILKGVSDFLNTDSSVNDSSRALRAPGTTNHPRAFKRAKGRVATPCSLEFLDPDLTFSIEDFEAFELRGQALRSKSGSADSVSHAVSRADTERGKLWVEEMMRTGSEWPLSRMRNLFAGRPVAGFDDPGDESARDYHVALEFARWLDARPVAVDGCAVSVLTADSEEDEESFLQAIADVVCHCRSELGDEKGKGSRADYLNRTAVNVLGHVRDGKEPTLVKSQRVDDAADPDETKSARLRRLLGEVIGKADCFRSPQGEAFASMPVGNHRETWSIDSEGFSDWVEREFWELTGSLPPEKPLEAAIRQARQKARFEGDERPVALRCALVGDLPEGGACIYIDLCNDDWEQIEVTASGYRIVQDSPVHMRRTPGMRPLPRPAGTGDLTVLRELLNVSTDHDFIIAVAWQLSVLLVGFPQPIQVVTGPQGSGKSMGSEVQGQLLDPNEKHLAGFPRNLDDLHVRAHNSRVLVIDNVSHLKEEISDELARASAGTSYRKRAHYANKKQVVLHTQNPITLNGIPDFVGRPDLAERCLFLDLFRIPKEERRSEGELWKLFGEAHPYILAGLLEAAVEGLKNFPSMKHGALERMADFHQWVRACEPGLPWKRGAFDAAYSANRDRAREKLMEHSDAFAALIGFMDDRGRWSGTSKELLAALRTHAGVTGDQDDSGWPKTGKGMSNLLRRVGAELAEEHIAYTEPKRANGGNRDRILTLRREKREETGNSTSQTSPSSHADVATPCDMGTVGTLGTMERDDVDQTFLDCGEDELGYAVGGEF